MSGGTQTRCLRRCRGVLQELVVQSFFGQSSYTSLFDIEHILEGYEADKLHHLSEFREVLDTVLNLLQSVSDRVDLMDGLEDRVPHGALVEEEIGHLSRFEVTACSFRDFNAPAGARGSEWSRQQPIEIVL